MCNSNCYGCIILISLLASLALQVWLPLHSALIYYFSIHVVERPQLLPSFLLFGFGWIMIANMFRRESHPNPWHRGHSFSHHWSVLVNGKARSQKGKTIHPMQGHKEAKKLEAKWNQRIEDDDEQYAKQLELDAKIKSISDDAVIRTKAKANGALVDPIAAVAGAKLLPYQQRLGGYCNQARFIRNVSSEGARPYLQSSIASHSCYSNFYLDFATGSELE